MAAANVQTPVTAVVPASSGTTLALPSLSAVGSGNSIIVVCVDIYPTFYAFASSVTDDQSNTYTLDWTSTQQGASNVRLRVFSAHNVTNAPTDITVTYSGTVESGVQAAAAFEVSGLSGTVGNTDEAVPTDVAASITASATNAESFYVGHAYVPFRTLTGSDETDSVIDIGDYAWFYGIPASSGSNTLGVAWSGSSEAPIAGIIYEASAGGGGVVIPRQDLDGMARPPGGGLSGGLVRRASLEFQAFLQNIHRRYAA